MRRLKTVGLCHEITITHFLLSLLLDVSFLELTPTVAGVNHLPFVTALDVAGDDGFERLRALLDDAASDDPLAMDPPDDLGYEKVSPGARWTRPTSCTTTAQAGAVPRFGVLPGAGDRHLAEFFPGFLTEESGWGARWGVPLTSIEERERDQRTSRPSRLLHADDVPTMPSGEMVAPVIRCFERRARVVPAQHPQHQPGRRPPRRRGGGEHLHRRRGRRAGRDHVELPVAVAECLRRVSSSQELTVEAAVTGDRDTVFTAMMLDPLAGRIDYDWPAQMTDELLAATAGVASAVRARLSVGSPAGRASGAPPPR